MRRMLSLLGLLVVFSPAALAADLPVRPVYKAPAQIVAYNWTGVYVGAHAGWAWSKLKGADEFGDPGSGSMDGFIGGGQIGANYQMGNMVIGVEGEFSYSDVHRKIDAAFGGIGGVRVGNQYYATAAARLGYAYDRMLFYVKGGAAWTREALDVNDGIGNTITGRFDRTGWLVGGGVEWAIFGNWSAKVEYDYIHFGGIDETSFVMSNPAIFSTGGAFGVSQENHLVKGGINYRF